MSVIAVEEAYQKRKFAESADDSTLTRQFKVECDDIADGPMTARFATGIPRKGDSMIQGDLVLRVASVDAQPIDDSDTIFEVTAQYSSKMPTFEANPLVRPATEDWSFASSNEPVFQDIHGKHISNSAGDRFIDGIQKQFHDPSVRLTKNYQDYDPAVAIAYADMLNSDAFTLPISGKVIQPGQAYFVSRTASRKFETEWYWEVVTEIDFRKEGKSDKGAVQSGWVVKVRDQGLREFRIPMAKPLNITDKYNHEITTPMDLDGQGMPITNPNADRKFIDVELYDSMPFAPIIPAS